MQIESFCSHQRIPAPLFVLEIWKACFTGLIESPEGTEELKWTAFTFLKVRSTSTRKTWSSVVFLSAFCCFYMLFISLTASLTLFVVDFYCSLEKE